ncbi:MAG TPA: GFA family protein [Pseudaminobacter sp.]|nr:GFA family protein [Pseudaminobacter sp.]
MLYKGSCHCGDIAFEVEGELSAVVACNCSICSRKGALLWAVPRARLRLTGSGNGIGTYAFNKHAIEHRFCRICGIHPFAEDAASEGEPSAYVNTRCLEDIDLASVPVIDFDGRSM